MRITKIIFGASLIVLFSCGGNNENKNKSLAQLEKKRTELKTKYEEIGKQLSEIEAQIALMDTSLKPPMVSVRNIAQMNFATYFQVQGNVETDKNAQVLAEIPGIIKKIFVHEGDEVKEGQRLIQLDDNLLRIQIQQLEMNLNLATDLFEKQERLWKQKIGSEVQFLQAKNQKENIQEQIRQVKETLNKYVVNAPFSGVVDQINFKEGEMANMMMPLLRVMNLSNMYMKADVSENYLAVVKKGLPVFVILPNIDTIEANVTRVGNFIKPENRTFQIRINLPSHELLKPNLVGVVKIADYNSKNVYTLRNSLIMHDATNRDFIFIAENKNNKYYAKKVLLEVNKSYNGLSEIKSGLNGNELVIDKGGRKLIDGQEIRIENK